MSNDDELRRFAKFLEDFDETAEVRVIERGLHLVEHVERRGPRLEDGNEERQRGEGSLATGKEGEPLDALASRTRFDFDARRQRRLRFGQHHMSLSPGEERGEDAFECLRNVHVCLSKD